MDFETIKQSAEKKVKDKLGVWHKVSDEAYKIASSISKDKHDDVISESESMTNKSIAMITSLLLFYGSFVGYLFGHPEILHNSITISLVSIGLVIVGITLGYLLSVVSPRDIYGKGVSPVNIIPMRIDADTNQGFEVKMIYVCYLVSLQIGIDYNTQLIEKRSGRYGNSLCLFCFAMLYLLIIGIYVI